MKLITKIIIGILMVLPMISNGQFLLNPPFNNYIRTSNPATMQKIGIGNFPTNASVQAKLHLSEFLLANDAATNGFMFRTDGSNTVNNSWQLFTGANAGSVTEKFKLFIPANSNDAVLQTTQNGAMKFNTNSTHRMIVNGDRTTAINGATGVNTSGYVGIGLNTTGNAFPNGVWTDAGPFSLLHLNGPDGGLGTWNANLGYRTWMQTGITFSGHEDLAYVGLRSLSSSNNITEMTINWSNDASSGVGPDDLVFRFTSGNNSTTISNNFNAVNDLDGRHIARFSSDGTMGLGPTFGRDNPIYVAPASLQHLSWNNFNSVYTQYTNRDLAVGSGTGETAADGLRIGIHGNNNPDMNGNALIYNQENRHLLFSTNANTNTLNFNNGTTLERMRITSVTTPTNLAGGGYGVYNPGGLSNNITRVAISHNPNTPVTRPLSLLHLGYNTSTILGQPSTNGWRDWMDIGTYTTNGYDNVYVGLKRENSGFFGNEKFDAIISWGDNGNNNPSTGPDHLRFIFTEGNDGSVAGDFPATSNNGLEVARFSPEKASTIPLIDSLNFGMMGIGDFSPSGTQGPGTPDYIDAKLDIDGDLRIRQVIEDTTLLQVLVIDSNDHNRVYWRDINSFTGNGTVTADNGLSIDPLNPNNVQLGNDVGLTTATLLNNRQVPMAGFNIQFDGLGIQGGNQISLGMPSPLPVLVGDPNLTSKFSTYNEDDLMAGEFLSDEQNFSGSSNGFTSTGQWGQTNMIGVSGIAIRRTSDFAVGVYGSAVDTSGSAILRGVVGQVRFGGSFGGVSCIGVHGIGENPNGGTNYGGYFEALNSPDRNFGVYCTAPIVPVPSGNPFVSLALYADGDAFVNGTLFLTTPAVVSDQQFKTNIDSIKNALDIINQLAPKTFLFDTTFSDRIHFQKGTQYGFIAQEVESILPSLVNNGVIPPVLDSIGNVSSPEIPYKSLNYNAFIAILMKGVQDQQAVLDDKDSIINNLETRLAAIEACINNIGICNNNGGGNGNKISSQSVTLENLTAIVLDQNLPNPFAESTQINFIIPDDVLNAKLLFYDMSGRIINEVNINERGNGTLTVYGENLEKGIYTYSLIADGKLIATKKMVKK